MGDPPTHRRLPACPLCRSPDRTVVCEFNRFLLLEESPGPDWMRTDYAVCHGCGLLYAVGRATGEAYRRLVRDFNESLGRPSGEGNPVLNPSPLTEEDRRELRRRIRPGSFVSEEAGVDPKDWLPALLSDRLAAAPHLELLDALLPQKPRRVLEVRSRTGALLDSMRRRYGAEVFALSIFESQQFVAREAYGIRADALIDFEAFEIPYEGSFDLIACKHMFTHAIDPSAFFACVRSKLSERGVLYLYSEPDDATAFGQRKSLFAWLNPFHQQAFDRPAFARGLRQAGFETLFVGRVEENHVCLARPGGPPPASPIAPEALQTRLAKYRAWRDLSILMLPEEVRRRHFSAELEAVQQRAVQAGLAERDGRGRVVPVKKNKDAAARKGKIPKRAPSLSGRLRSFLEKLGSR